jgi:hypothetical protein
MRRALAVAACACAAAATAAAADGTSPAASAATRAATAVVADGTPKPVEAATPSNSAQSNTQWRLVEDENFNQPLGVNSAPWVRDPLGTKSPWYVQYFGEDGEYYKDLGGPAFQKDVDSFDLMRKQVTFGKNGWLTAELAQEDYTKTGHVTDAPSLTETKLPTGGNGAVLQDNTNDGGIVIRDTKPLPPEYKIEYTLNTINFGGERNGSLTSDGKYNGYNLSQCNTSYPWNATDNNYSGPTNPCNSNFPSSVEANGYYFLYVTGFPDAPHDNAVVHDRKVGFDAYNTTDASEPSAWVCNPKTKKLYPYTSSNRNAINATFSMGNDVASSSIEFPGQLYQTPCGTYTNQNPNTSLVELAEIQPQAMPDHSYTFAIERTSTGYTLQVTGDFRYIGQTTITETRKFVQDGVPIWHYNNTPQQYNGDYNASLTDSGPYGSFTIPDIWPKGSSYPDYFVIGDPHLNYYEGSSTISNIRLYVPKGAAS